MSEVLPEIPEAGASADIAALYADMRAVTGVLIVNLIYRHIATVPNGLAWVWSVLRPHIASGSIGSLAPGVLARAALNRWNERSPVGALPPHERDAVTSIVSWYNRGNAVNLVALLALRAAPSEVSPRSDEAVPAAAQEATPAAVPPPPPLLLGEVEAPLRDRIFRLCELQGLSGSGLTPTMYLHLARWPTALALILDSLERMMDSGEFDRDVAVVVESAEAAVRRLGKSFVAYERPPDPAGRAVIDRAIETFTTRAIPQMLTVGTYLVHSR